MDAVGVLGGAIAFDQESMFIEALEANPDMMYFSNSRKSWLHYAANQGRSGIIDYLLNKGFNVNFVASGERMTALDSAVLADDVPHRADIVRTLLARGADANLSRPAIYAMNSRRRTEAFALELVKLLVEGGLDVNRQYDLHGDPANTFTALEHAKDEGWQAIADYLRSQGAADRPDRPPPAPPPGENKRRE